MAFAYRAIKAYDVSMHLEGAIAGTLTANTDHFPSLSQSYPTWLLALTAEYAAVITRLR